MEFNLNDRVRCTDGEHANKQGIVKKASTLKLEKTKACIVQFDNEDNLVMIYHKDLTKI